MRGKRACQVRRGAAGNVPDLGQRADRLLYAGVRRPGSLSQPTQESAFLLMQGRLETWTDRSEPPALEPGESSEGWLSITMNLYTPTLTCFQEQRPEQSKTTALVGALKTCLGTRHRLD